MVYMTMIARVADGLPLAASIQEDEQVIFFWSKKGVFMFYSLGLIHINLKSTHSIIWYICAIFLDGEEYSGLSATSQTTV